MKDVRIFKSLFVPKFIFYTRGVQYINAITRIIHALISSRNASRIDSLQILIRGQQHHVKVTFNAVQFSPLQGKLRYSTTNK